MKKIYVWKGACPRKYFVFDAHRHLNIFYVNSFKMFWPNKWEN